MEENQELKDAVKTYNLMDVLPYIYPRTIEAIILDLVKADGGYDGKTNLIPDLLKFYLAYTYPSSDIVAIARKYGVKHENVRGYSNISAVNKAHKRIFES